MPIELETFGPDDPESSSTPEDNGKASLQDLSDDDIESLLTEPTGDPNRQINIEFEDPKPKRAKIVKAQEDEPGETDEPAAEVEPEPEDRPEPEPKPAAASADKEPEEDPRDLLIKELEARSRHFESLVGRESGRLSFLEKRLQEIQSREPQYDRTYRDEDEEPIPEPRSKRRYDPVYERVDRLERQNQQLLNMANQQAAKNAYAEFQGQYADHGEYEQEISEHLRNKASELQSAFGSGDPTYAGQETLRLLSEAYWGAKRAAIQRRREEIEKRRLAEVDSLREKKKQTTPAASETKPQKSPSYARLQDVPDDVLERTIREHFGRRVVR